MEEMQRAGFPMGGEPLVAVDLADTVMTAVRPAEDLIASAEAAEKWWQLEASGLPAGPMPAPRPFADCGRPSGTFWTPSSKAGKPTRPLWRT